MITVTRYHDISCGHRVAGHEGKCRGLHGHNYRIHFTCAAEGLDTIGRVIDFSVIKSKLCEWLERYWDHKFLIWAQDPIVWVLRGIGRDTAELNYVIDSIVTVPFNPTAELMAQYLLDVVGPNQLDGTGVKVIFVEVEETRKCSAGAALP